MNASSEVVYWMEVVAGTVVGSVVIAVVVTCMFSVVASIVVGEASSRTTV